jgi:hypothetical protein
MIPFYMYLVLQQRFMVVQSSFSRCHCPVAAVAGILCS